MGFVTTWERVAIHDVTLVISNTIGDVFCGNSRGQGVIWNYGRLKQYRSSRGSRSFPVVLLHTS
jgi:hypothetical protein